MRSIEYIVVHCTAGNQGQKAKDVVYYHTGPKWKGCLGWKSPGYHYIVESDGTVVCTHPEDCVSNGVRGHNAESINVCWVGGVDTGASKPFPAVDNRTDEQRASLRRLLKELKGRYPGARILGHRDFSEDKNGNGVIDPWERIKECPCFDAMEEYCDL